MSGALCTHLEGRASAHAAYDSKKKPSERLILKSLKGVLHSLLPRDPADPKVNVDIESRLEAFNISHVPPQS